jgi:hypothetical protein
VADTIPPVLIELQLETARISAQMQQMQSNFSQFGATVEKQTGFLSKFKAAAAGVFAGNIMTNGLNSIQNAMKGAIQDAQEYELVVAQLEAGLKSTGNAAGLSVEGLKQQASALEELTAVDENLIMQSQAVFQTFTNVRNVVGEGNDIFNQASMAALDLSVKMKGDLQGATVQLGKALNDPVKGITALTRVGVVFTEQQKSQIKTLVEAGDVMGAQKIILAEMNTEFGGAAAAAGDTFAGAIFRAKDKVGDFARDLVTNLQPILLNIGKTIGDLYNQYLAPLFSWLGKNKEAIAAMAAVVLTAVVAIKLYNAALVIGKAVMTAYKVAQVLMTGGQLASIASTNGLAASMLKLNATMAANPIGLIVAALALVAAGFVFAWNKSETFRKVVVEIAKGVVTYIAFMVRAWGGLIEIILKVVSGPLRLFLGVLSKLPGVGGAAKKGLEIINKGIEGVGDFADKTANKIEGFKTTLDGLKDKKISIPGFGGKKKDDTGATEGGATAPTGSGSEKAAKEAKERAEKMQEAIKDANKKFLRATEDNEKKIVEIKDRYAKLETKIIEKKNEQLKENEEKWLADRAKAHEQNAKELVKIEENYAKQVANITASYTSKVQDLNESANEKILDAQKAAAEKRASIVQQSIDRLRNAFASGTAASIADIFKQGAQTAGDVIEALKKKLEGAKDLQANLGKLAAAGYSQKFIEEIAAQGPETGNEMAKALLGASGDTQRELQDLYSLVNDTSAHGVDELAQTMNAGGKLATEELMKAYNDVPKDLARVLAEINNDLQKSLNDALGDYMSALAEAAAARDAAIAESKAKLIESLAAADAELATANEKTMTDFKDALKDNAEALTDALEKQQQNYADAIDRIAEATADKIGILKSQLAEVRGLIAGIAAANSALSAPTITVPTSTTPMPPAPGLGGIPGGGIIAASAPTINNNISVTANTNASPSQIADVINTRISFGSPYTISLMGV